MPGSAEPMPPAPRDQYVRVRASNLAWRQAGDEAVVLDLAAPATTDSTPRAPCCGSGWLTGRRPRS